jgi:hypothetical protein
MLFAFSFFTVAEAVNGIGVSNTPNEDLVELLADLRKLGIEIFKIAQVREATMTTFSISDLLDRQPFLVPSPSSSSTTANPRIGILLP